jgi:hypothetical protein
MNVLLYCQGFEFVFKHKTRNSLTRFYPCLIGEAIMDASVKTTLGNFFGAG